MSVLHRQDGGRLTLTDNLATPTAAEGLVVMGKYNSSAPTYADADVGFFQLTSDGRLKVDADISLTDIDVEIGAIEIKNATDDTRAVVKTDGTDNALVVMMNALPTTTDVIGAFIVSDGTNSAEVTPAGLLKVDASEVPINISDLAISGIYAEDSVHTSGHDGMFVLGVRNDTLATLATTDGDYAPFQVSATGALFVTNELKEDAQHASGDYGTQVLAVRNDTLAALVSHDNDNASLQVNATGALYSIEVPTTEATAAPSITRDTSVDEVAAVAIKAAAGNVYGYSFDNPNGYDVFVKWYNTAAGSVTVGTTAVVRTTRVPAVGSVFVEADKPQQNFTTAISIACTKLIADSDTTAIASDIYAEVYYK